MEKMDEDIIVWENFINDIRRDEDIPLPDDDDDEVPFQLRMIKKFRKQIIHWAYVFYIDIYHMPESIVKKKRLRLSLEKYERELQRQLREELQLEKKLNQSKKL